MIMDGRGLMERYGLFEYTIQSSENHLLFAPQKGKGFPKEILIIKAKQNEILGDECIRVFCTETSKERGFDHNFLPKEIWYQMYSPKNRRYFLYTWTVGQRRMRNLFLDYCEAANREARILGPDYRLFFPGDKFSFLEATLIHRQKLNSLKSISSRHRQLVTADAFHDRLSSMLKIAAASSTVVESWSFLDETEARLTPFREEVYGRAKRRATAIEKLITAEYGKPVATGTSECNSIPEQDVFRFAIWKKGKRLFYLCCSHFDQLLDVTIVLGTRKLS